ncbi:type II toxin-antitoxin system HipA family toxin [Cellulomonas soli]|uniref:Phosphatidylinositol kinase n=1 Tax=Cellulomonas soli TaxID=931535 RepID=A0A512PDV0_9CELL|nr:HipA domain-containing protein [Cellulomonas soli]NYI59119.1 serine/threonine-protein kinase HipA [Cellulomonas soli]GEP69389.1 phosphatidylinositol kinase [Cellulomonas soli]
MISEQPGTRAYVWVWLPGATSPVVAGVLQATGTALAGEPVLAFRYAASYRARPDAISLYPPELPLGSEVLDPTRVAHRDPLALAGCLRDAAPDAWGRRVINLEVGHDPDVHLSEVTYLLRSGSDRIGALDFQESPTQYVPREQRASLDQLMEGAALVERGEHLPPALAAVGHGTSIGGARPKALLHDGDRHLIAKFSSSTDDRPVVKAEGAAMLLAARAGADVAPVSVVHAGGKDVLLVERFDRQALAGPDGQAGIARRQMLSMLTVLGLSESSARYGSYALMAQQVRTGPWADVPGTLRELFTRLVINVLVGNTDDHLRNHAAFWDGTRLSLTPAYDIAPQRRSTNTATQAIGITADGRRASQLRLCREVAGEFLLTDAQAIDNIGRVRAAVVDGWDDVCDQVGLTRAERATLWGREFAHPYVDYAEA